MRQGTSGVPLETDAHRTTAAEVQAGAPLGHDWRQTCWLLLLTLLGGILRLYRLGGNSLWVDEFTTLRIAALPLPEISSTAVHTNFVAPLYFWLVHGVQSIFGTSEFSLRLTSAVAGTLTVPAVWWLTKELTRSGRVAALCAGLLAISPLHVWYSQEARPYALLLWFACSALWLLLLASRTGTLAHWVGFTVCMSCVLLTHSTGAPILAVAWGWALLARWRPVVLSRLLLASVVALLVFAPFGIAISRAVGEAESTHSPPRPFTGLEIPYTLLTYVTGYSFGPSVREIQNIGALPALRSHLLQSAIAVAAVGVLLASILWRPGPGAKYFAVLLIVPFVIAIAGSAISGKAYNVRYVLAAMIGFLGLAGGTLAGFRPKVARSATAALVGLCLWSDAQWYFSPRYRKDDARAAVAWLSDHLPPVSTVAVAPGYAAVVLSYYAREQGAQLRIVPATPVSPPANPPAALLLTRLHHVPEQKALADEFRRSAGARLVEHTVVGYEILARTGREWTPPPD